MRFLDAVKIALRPDRITSVPRLDNLIGTQYASAVPQLNAQADADFSLAYLACELAKIRPISVLPIHVYEKDRKTNNREGARNDCGWHLQWLLQGRWNPMLTSASGIRWVMYAKDTRGNAYVRVQWDPTGRFPVALYPLTMGVTEYWDQATGTVSYMYAGDEFTPSGALTDKEVIRFTSPLPSNDGIHGRSLPEAAARNVGLSIDIEEFYHRLLTNGSHMPIWLETDERLTQNDRNDLVQSLENTRGVLNAGTLRVFDKGLRLRQSNFTMTDIDLSKQQSWILQQMCRVCGIPPQEVYDLSRSTYSNVNQSSIQFAQKTLMPECRSLEVAFNGVLRAAGEFDTYVKWDINGLLRGDFADRMDAYRIGIYAGFYTRNEVREFEDLNDLPGLDAPLIPVNYFIVNEQGEVVNPLPPSETGNDSKGGVYQPNAEDEKDVKSAQDNPAIKDLEKRIIQFKDEEEDPEKVRQFAIETLTPYLQACLFAGLDWDMDEALDRLLGE